MKQMYKVVDQSPDMGFPFRSIWNPFAPPKMGFFVWEATWGKVLTLDQLKRPGRIILANRCYLCEEDEETIEQLLVNCKKVRML